VKARLPSASARPSSPWRDLAACRGTDLKLFFPPDGASAEPARLICAQCAVRQPCLDYALRNGILHGIWGGLAERERRTLRTRHLRAIRQDRDRAILAARAAGYTTKAIARAFGLSSKSVSRVLSRTVNGSGQP
jgi:WhiB family redox-sensing transcriptional regulator